MDKLSRAEYFELFLQDNVTDEQILNFSKVVKGEGGFEWTLEPDPEKVAVTQDEVAAESIGQVVNPSTK